MGNSSIDREFVYYESRLGRVSRLIFIRLFYRLNRRENKTGNSSETENRLKFTLDAKIKTILLHLHPMKRLELENQQLFLGKKMAPKKN